MCCCCGKTCMVLTSGIYILIQSLIYTILATLGIALYNCTYIDKIKDYSDILLIYFTYFFDISGCPKGRNLFFNSLPNSKISYIPPRIEPSDRNFTYMQGYAALNLLWAVSSIFFIISVFVKKEKKYNLFSYIFFLLVGIGNLILDCIAIGVYTQDIYDTQTVTDYFHFLGFNVQNIYVDIDVGMVPSIFMVTMFARIGFFWLGNLGVVISTISLCFSHFKQSKGKVFNDPNQTNGWQNQNIPRFGPNHLQENSGSGNRMAFYNTDQQNGQQYNDHSYPSNFPAPSAPLQQNNHQIPEWEKPPTFPHEPSTPDWELNRRPQQYNESRPSYQSSDHSILTKSSVSSEMHGNRYKYNSQDSLEDWEPTPGPSKEIYNRGERQRNRPHKKKPKPSEQPMPSRSSWDHSSVSSFASHGGTGSNTPSSRAPGSRAGSKSSRDTLDDIPSVSPREEYSSHLEKESNKKPQRTAPQPYKRNESTHQIEPARVFGGPQMKYDDALRSSRPWSYFYPAEPPIAPRQKNFEYPEVKQDDELPPVPVPDYTLHFPSKRTYAPLKM